MPRPRPGSSSGDDSCANHGKAYLVRRRFRRAALPLAGESALAPAHPDTPDRQARHRTHPGLGGPRLFRPVTFAGYVGRSHRAPRQGRRARPRCGRWPSCRPWLDEWNRRSSGRKPPRMRGAGVTRLSPDKAADPERNRYGRPGRRGPATSPGPASAPAITSSLLPVTWRVINSYGPSRSPAGPTTGAALNPYRRQSSGHGGPARGPLGDSANDPLRTSSRIWVRKPPRGRDSWKRDLDPPAPRARPRPRFGGARLGPPPAKNPRRPACKRPRSLRPRSPPAASGPARPCAGHPGPVRGKHRRKQQQGRRGRSHSPTVAEAASAWPQPRPTRRPASGPRPAGPAGGDPGLSAGPADDRDGAAGRRPRPGTTPGAGDPAAVCSTRAKEAEKWW